MARNSWGMGTFKLLLHGFAPISPSAQQLLFKDLHSPREVAHCAHDPQFLDRKALKTAIPSLRIDGCFQVLRDLEQVAGPR